MRNNFKNAAIAVVIAAFCSIGHADDKVDFFRAVGVDNSGGVQRLIDKGFDPNVKDERGQTGLILAIREQSPKVVDVLIASPKVNVEARNSSDESPLMMAALKGNKAAVDKLIARDADINKTGWAPLHYAATGGQIEIMKVLLEKSAFIDAQSPNGTTPLMMAAMYGSPEAVKLLIDEGADLNMKNQQGMTALDFANKGNRKDAAGLLTDAAKARKPAAAGK
ncbi:ankyrin repeat domain-containing protein [Variovorax dokdonensis]|uniref:Ankyrin repeat domain-containing protein n=1 Tax=Variovorax dokdonensis TaxID=344883 RepID=A0ABT7NGT1_9BURK|nr:ankyrin repeat domain-containing protein [Variovorax dokdonensis]MDM0047122.1 ankyrin repeat domain-containing protein [Variovorax dokdonensis]